MLERLRPDHAPALLRFEQENRAYFARSIPDRGDDYFTHFTARLEALLAEQAEGICHFHVITENDEILGRVNLVDVSNGMASLGFRIAEKATGQGLATASVREVLSLASGSYGLRTIRAAAAVTNIGSQTVLARTGFTPTGETVELSGKPGRWYQVSLTTG